MPLSEKRMSQPVSQDEKHQQGIKLFQEGQFEEAVRLISEALLGTETSERWNDWATVVLSCGRPTEAEKGFRRALEMDPQNREAAVNLGVLLASLEQDADAVPFLERGMAGADAKADKDQRAQLVGLLADCRARQTHNSKLILDDPSFAPAIRESSEYAPSDMNLVPYGEDLRHDSLKIELFYEQPIVFETSLDEIEAVAKFVRESAGYILELGVFKGRSINRMSVLFPDETIWGFDSFKGLPENWVRTKNGELYKAGHFALEELPRVGPNVKLVAGFFEDTLPTWLSDHSGGVRLLHIDADLYSSAKTVLKQLNHMIEKGTVIIFDELCDWRNSGIFDAWEDCEWKALKEWLQEYDRRIRILSRTVDWSAAVLVTK